MKRIFDETFQSIHTVFFVKVAKRYRSGDVSVGILRIVAGNTSDGVKKRFTSLDRFRSHTSFGNLASGSKKVTDRFGDFRFLFSRFTSQ